MSTILVDNLTGKTSAGSITVTSEGGAATQSLQQGLAKAWFQATNAAVLNDSFNVASGTDNGTGDYSYNLTSVFANASYSQPCSGRVAINNTRNAMFNSSRQNASTLAVFLENESGTAVDANHIASAHGDLA